MANDLYLRIIPGVPHDTDDWRCCNNPMRFNRLRGHQLSVDKLQEHGDRLYVWKSNYSAGMASKDGGICAQGALTAVATSLTASAKGSGGAPNTPSAELTFGQQQALAMINASNNQTAYANIAFFYLCQIANNAKLSPDQIVQMWSQTNLAIATVGAAGASTTVSSSPLSGSSGGTTTTVKTETPSNGPTKTLGVATPKSAESQSTTTTTTETVAPSSASGTISKGVADALKNLSETVKQQAPASPAPTTNPSETPPK